MTRSTAATFRGSRWARSSRLGGVRGDVILISLPTEEPGGVLGGVPRTMRLRVSSIFASGLYEYDSSFGVVLAPTAGAFFRLDGMITGYQLRIPDMFHAAEDSRALETALGPSYRVT